ncbi:uncharacterized protein KZ484_014079 isoform 5-T5 [Pholidichthys leucotaenia]
MAVHKKHKVLIQKPQIAVHKKHKAPPWLAASLGSTYQARPMSSQIPRSDSKTSDGSPQETQARVSPPTAQANVATASAGEVMSGLLKELKGVDQKAAATLREAGICTDAEIQCLSREDLNGLFPGAKNLKLRRKIFDIILQKLSKTKPTNDVLKEVRNLVPEESLRGDEVLVDYLCLVKDIKTQVNNVTTFFDVQIDLLEEGSKARSLQEPATEMRWLALAGPKPGRQRPAVRLGEAVRQRSGGTMEDKHSKPSKSQTSISDKLQQSQVFLKKICEYDQEAALVLQREGLITDADIQSLTQKDLDDLFPEPKHFKLKRILHQQKLIDIVLKDLRGSILLESLNAALTGDGVLVQYKWLLQDNMNKVDNVQNFLKAHLDLLEDISKAQPHQQPATAALTGDGVLVQYKRLLQDNMNKVDNVQNFLKAHLDLLEDISKAQPHQQPATAALTGDGVLVQYKRLLQDNMNKVDNVQNFLKAHLDLLEDISKAQPHQHHATGSVPKTSDNSEQEKPQQNLSYMKKNPQQVPARVAPPTAQANVTTAGGSVTKTSDNSEQVKPQQNLNYMKKNPQQVPARVSPPPVQASVTTAGGSVQKPSYTDEQEKPRHKPTDKSACSQEAPSWTSHLISFFTNGSGSKHSPPELKGKMTKSKMRREKRKLKKKLKSSDNSDDLMAQLPFALTSPTTWKALFAEEASIQKKRKRKRGDSGGRVDSEEDGEKKKKKREGQRPNYFVSIPITNTQISTAVAEVQEAILQQEPRLIKAMIPVPTLHITLLVMHLSNQEQVDLAAAALAQTEPSLAELLGGRDLVLPFSGINHFRKEVVFVSLAAGPHRDTLDRLAELLRSRFEEQGLLQGDCRGFEPHLTIMKLSRASKLRSQGIKRVDPALYSDYMNKFFGDQTVERVDLCSMLKKKQQEGYYHTETTLRLGGRRRSEPDEAELLRVSKRLVEDAVNRALQQYKQEALQNGGGPNTAAGQPPGNTEETATKTDTTANATTDKRK